MEKSLILRREGPRYVNADDPHNRDAQFRRFFDVRGLSVKITAKIA